MPLSPLSAIPGWWVNMDEPDTWPIAQQQNEGKDMDGKPGLDGSVDPKNEEESASNAENSTHIVPSNCNKAEDMPQNEEEILREEVRRCYRTLLDAEDANTECERTHDSVRRVLYGDLSLDLGGSYRKLDSPRSLYKLSRSETSLNDIGSRNWTVTRSPRYDVNDYLYEKERMPPSSYWRPKSYNRYNRYERFNQRPPAIKVSGTTYDERLEPKRGVSDASITSSPHVSTRSTSAPYTRDDLMSSYERRRPTASVNQPDEEGRIPLHYAAMKGNIVTLQNLVRKGAIINAVDDHGKSPLSYAVEHGSTTLVRELIFYGAYVNQKDHHGRTPLIVAVANGKKLLVDILLRNGASVFLQDKDLKAPIHYASENNQPTVVEELLRYGAPINQSDANQRKPLHIAAESGHLFVLELLMRKGANLDPLDRNMQTPLFLAIEQGLEFIVHALLQSGASACSSDRHRQTPLHLAACTGHVAIASDLLYHNARVEARDEKGKSPIFYAVEAKNLQMLELLRHHHAHVDVTDNTGKSLLSYAIDTRDDDIIYFVAKNELKLTSNRFILLKHLQVALIQNCDFLARTVWNHLLDHCILAAHDPVESRILESTVKVLLDLTCKSFQRSQRKNIWKAEYEFKDGKLIKPTIIAFVESMPSKKLSSYMGVPVLYLMFMESSLDNPTDVSLSLNISQK